MQSRIAVGKHPGTVSGLPLIYRGHVNENRLEQIFKSSRYIFLTKLIKNSATLYRWLEYVTQKGNWIWIRIS